MKHILLILGVAVATAVNVSATMLNWYSGSVNSTLADNSPAGTTFNTSGGSWSGSWSTLGSSGDGYQLDNRSGNISVTLNISGGYNNDLYGYLIYTVNGSSQTEILLNRVSGTGSGFGSGAATSDFATLQSAGVTLVDGAGTSIHAGAAGAGASYTPDSPATLSGTFGGMTSGGTWTLFLADLAAGDQSTLVSWGLNVSVVPEPVTYALGIFCGALGLVGLGRRISKQRA